jgi:ABC-type Fe3+ transport system permease subunit
LSNRNNAHDCERKTSRQVREYVAKAAESSMNHSRKRGPLRIVGRVLYWLVVLAVSLALLVALVMFFEARDESQIEEGARTGVIRL